MKFPGIPVPHRAESIAASIRPEAQHPGQSLFTDTTHTPYWFPIKLCLYRIIGPSRVCEVSHTRCAFHTPIVCRQIESNRAQSRRLVLWVHVLNCVGMTVECACDECRQVQRLIAVMVKWIWYGLTLWSTKFETKKCIYCTEFFYFFLLLVYIWNLLQ